MQKLCHFKYKWQNERFSLYQQQFGTDNADAPLPSDIAEGVIGDNAQGVAEWKELVGGETLSSKFQDGHYVYTVVAGYGSGTDVYPPVLFVGDIENMVHFNNVLEP